MNQTKHGDLGPEHQAGAPGGRREGGRGVFIHNDDYVDDLK